MPATYLLLRNNQQTGPLGLDELLQQHLQADDLIWAEGNGAGWRYPYEIDALKAYVSNRPPSSTQTRPLQEETKQNDAAEPKIRVSHASHIYVSLPAGISKRDAAETPETESLEQKAEALYQRMQAFSEGKKEVTTNSHYNRSLDTMQQEYDAWLQKQQKRKSSSYKKKWLVAGTVVAVTVTGLGISNWVHSNSLFQKETETSYTPGSTFTAIEKAPADAASFTAVADSAMPETKTNMLPTDSTAHIITIEKKDIKPLAASRKKPLSRQKKVQAPALDPDSGNVAPAIVPVKQPVVQQEVKKVVPLSRLLTVNGTFNYGRNGNSITGIEVMLQNNSSEELKSVVVVVTYFKKKEHALNKEMVTFRNVQPYSAPVLKAGGNRRASSATFDIGTITRADGSLYLIH